MKKIVVMLLVTFAMLSLVACGDSFEQGMKDAMNDTSLADRETEEEAKKEKYKKMLLYLEKTLEGIDPYGKGAGRFMNLTFSLLEVRERLEEGEAKA